MYMSNQKVRQGSNFGNIAANDHCLCFQKLFFIFHLFQVEWKTKILFISEITRHFRKV